MAVTLRLLAVAAACACVFAAEAPGVVAVQPVDANKGAALVPADAGSKTPKAAGDRWALVAAAKGFGSALFNSVTMIIATELGDKTFCIAAVMAMRHNRFFVFAGAIGALIVMTFLSVGIGAVMPAVLPKVYTHYAAAALFAYFGYRLCREAMAMTGKESHEELAETEAELGGGEGSAAAAGAGGGASPAPSSELSAGATAVPLPPPDYASHKSSPKARTLSEKDAAAAAAAEWWTPSGAVTLLSVYVGRDWTVITQAFTLTFLAEWGDRSQIATIAMAAAQNWLGVTLGGVIGHSLCTGLAVIGGRLLASRISERTVAWVGGLLFFAFAAHSVYVGPEVDE